MGTKPFLILVAVASISLAGCGGSDKSTPDTPTTEAVIADSTVAQPQTTDATAPVTEAVVADSAAAEPSVDSTVDSTVDTALEAPATTTAAAPATDALAVTDVQTPPGQSDDKFVGAASDVKTESCTRGDAGWTAAGTVTNSSGTAANYRIYVAFNRKGTTDTRALVQTNVSVPNGATQPWKASAATTDTDLICILRVERTA